MADCYCFLCGGNAEVSQALDNDLKHAFSVMSEKLVDPAVMAKLRFEPHDVAFQHDLCLIGLFDEQYDVLIDGLVFDTDAIEAIDVHTVRVLDNVVPGDLHRFATVRHQPTGREYVINGTVFPFVHAGCWHILQDVLEARGYEYPERIFWGVVREMNLYSPAITAIENVDYGLEIENTHGGEVVRPLANLLHAYRYALPKQLVSGLEAGEISDEMLYQYWLGCGAMWVNVSPHCPSHLNTTHAPLWNCYLWNCLSWSQKSSTVSSTSPCFSSFPRRSDTISSCAWTL
ncbi:hypothetical protein EXIGLDRAFT_695041 [Exidia glandulosa HHB12029]|uniref:Uncharacterized protein n=1 Tax=Exidia glandulosa HHB12029 TaxID=1314781 RepID=A0A165G6M1_EXIGL|nr:hypothetical protein EXIGLDRAFT_695041 [Exidia glandulosa HHB12029]